MLLVQNDSLLFLKSRPCDFVDALITDPPAGINFMGKDWDTHQDFNKTMEDIFKECLRVLKPGAHGLVWAIPRTAHKTAYALECSGFEIRDVIIHLFGTGFPKSHNLKAVMSGWGTALKPASEHWILVRKPLAEKTIAKNVIKHGTGGINIDDCRIGTEHRINKGVPSYQGATGTFSGQSEVPTRSDKETTGRFPANLVLSHNEDCELLGKATRFFYCAKASKSDRGKDNNHPTVKSTKLMEYLIKLITPPNGTVLDPFMGSGSTGVAAKSLGFDFIGIEKEKEYYDIANKRISSHEDQVQKENKTSYGPTHKV